MKNILFFLPGLKNTHLILFDENFGIILEKKIENPRLENKEIFDFLGEINFDFGKILFLSGPGRFMSLKICETIINTLKFTKPFLKLYEMKTFEYFYEKSLEKNIKVLLQLNQTEVLEFDGKSFSKKSFEMFFDEKILWIGNVKNKLKLPESFEEITKEKDFKDFLSKFLIKDFEVLSVKSFYI